MNLLKLLLGLATIILAAIAKYYQIQGWQIPGILVFTLIALASLFLIIFLVSLNNGPGRNPKYMRDE
jgi:hypothetical protein